MEDISLKNRKKIPKEIKYKRNKKILQNLLISNAITIYFLFINLGFYNIENNVYSVDLKIFSITILILSIAFLEKGYKKDNESIFFNGIEMMFVSFITLLMQFRLIEPNNTIEILFGLTFMYFIIYYIIKSLIQTRIIEKQYSTSDAKEIVK